MTAVSKFSKHQQKPCHHQQVGDDNPGDGSGVGTEVCGNDRQNHIDDGSVKAVHDDTDRNGGEEKFLVKRVFNDIHRR